MSHKRHMSAGLPPDSGHCSARLARQKSAKRWGNRPASLWIASARNKTLLFLPPHPNGFGFPAGAA
jgi:hypothetical protein